MDKSQSDIRITASEELSPSKVNLNNRILTWIAAGVAAFHIWANTFGDLSDLWRNALHLGLLGFLAFILYTGIKKKEPRKGLVILNVFLAVALLSSSVYLILFENALHNRNEVPVLADLIFAGMAIILAIELARRTSGYVIPALALVFLSYVLWWGRHVEGIFSFRGMNLSRVLYRMFFTDEGLFGMIASISSTYVFMFILFAAFLLKSGGGDFIIKLSQSLTRKIAAGPGIVAVLASGLMGTISGSAVANTVSTGSITIPMMKRAGFDARFAAAVETASSTGGQLMPPIMGAGAFIMSQWTQIPYATIIGVALLPAILYFASVAFYVVLEARRKGIHKTQRQAVEPESPSKILKEGIPFVIPILLLVIMLAAGFTPTYTAGFAICAVVVSSWISKHNRMSLKDIVDALATGTINMIPTGILLITAGIIIGTINMTGISITFSQLIVQWSGANLLLALLLVTGASLLLGMGLPVTAAYIMIAILTVPALTSMGVSLLAAHMIIFWLSQDSNVTPPVCLAAFAASSISGSRPMATGFTSWKLAKGLYIMPILFAYTGLINGSWTDRIVISSFALIGLFAFTVAFTGYMFGSLNVLARIFLFLCAIAIFWPGSLWLNCLGVCVLSGIGIYNKKAP
ncbi:MAG TPA: TRAP transporter fused permease subunit [Candidatus Heimdallarchaeota archaeon]|nr:TRAP transporter fused permease subunit [Candidatus Heimdallarchaeota archaeon]